MVINLCRSTKFLQRLPDRVRPTTEYGPVAVFVEDAESLPQLFLAICLPHLLCHHVNKLLEVYRPVA